MKSAAIVCTPVPEISKSIVFVALVVALESKIASRSDPGPLSAAVVTSNVCWPATSFETAIRTEDWSGAEPSDSAARLRTGMPS